MRERERERGWDRLRKRLSERIVVANNLEV